MLENISKLECKIGERTYQLLCKMDSPLHELKEALFEFSKFIGQVEDRAKAQQEAERIEAESKEVDESKFEDVEVL